MELRNISLARGRRILLGNLNFSCESPQRVAIIGKNGCGKSTLLQGLAGLLNPVSGEVLCNGLNISVIPLAERSRVIGYLPSQLTFAFSYTAGQIVQLGRFPWNHGNPSKMDWLRVDAELDRLGILETAKRPIEELSDGERQKVAIARLGVGEAPIWLLDEPFSHLDPGGSVAICQYLAERANGAKMIIASLHQLELVSRFFDQVIGISSSGSLFCGNVSELTGDVVKALFGAAQVEHHDLGPSRRIYEFN